MERVQGIGGLRHPAVADRRRDDDLRAVQGGHVDRMAAQLREGGIAVDIGRAIYPNGRFARLTDPEGNPIQLWQTGGKAPG